MPKRSEASLCKYRIFETDEFSKRLGKLPRRDASFIQKKLSSFVYPQIREEPFFGNNIKKLRGYAPDTWRYRIGRFRLFYSVDQDDAVIYILTINQPKDAYR